jgi:hypothetical protein
MSTEQWSFDSPATSFADDADKLDICIFNSGYELGVAIQIAHCGVCVEVVDPVVTQGSQIFRIATVFLL